MDHVVITIARQYGSGGRTVGKMLAERLGISFYDKQIIHMASDESGIDVNLFGKIEAGDKIKSSLFGNKSSIYKGAQSLQHFWSDLLQGFWERNLRL